MQLLLLLELTFLFAEVETALNLRTRNEGRERQLELQRQYLLGVFLGLYLLACEDLLDDALLVDDEGRSDSAHGCLAIH